VSVTVPKGFVASGVACGIKDSGALDLSFVATEDGRPVAAAGVFTSNKMTAAPVIVTNRHLEHTGGRAVGVVLNSGNANAAMGAQGEADAIAMCEAAAAALGCDPHEILVCSTGLIGIPLPIDTVRAGIPAVVAARSVDGGGLAAEAIRTTDTHAKQVVIEGEGFTVGGMAKGAAMLEPNMATMLAVLTTDAEATPAQLKAALVAGIEESFNALSTDGCQSTNDTVLLFASGAAGPAPDGALDAAVAAACADLAGQMAGDAEGATKVVRVTVIGAASDAEAKQGARKVADSNLCKCSWYGLDPYWGRICSELGSAGIEFDQARVSVRYGTVQVAAGGVEIPHDKEAVAAHMAGRHLDIVADLGLGAGTGSILTNDLTHAYIDENTGGS
jgi:glutamate N-acetyltransferase/amino-acid N-acetyltransferase